MRPIRLDADLLSVVPAPLRQLLVARYDAPPRCYHTIHHAEAVARHVRELGGDRAGLLAAWFHDAVYDGRPGEDEARSARLLTAWLRGNPDAAEAARLVGVTAGHDPAEGDDAGAILSDADLAVLGATPADYEIYRRQVRADFAHVDDGAWRVGRAAVVRGLLERPRIFRTVVGAGRWEDQARDNLAAELGAL